MTVNSHKNRFAPVETGARRLRRLGMAPVRGLAFVALLLLATWDLTRWQRT